MVKKEPIRVFTYITNVFIVLTVIYLAIFTPYKYLLQTKIISFYTICGGYAAIMLLLSLEGMAVGMVKPRELLTRLRPTTAVQWGMIFYLLFSFVSALLSKYPSTWIGATRYEGFLTVAIYVASFYFVSKFAKPSKWMMYAFGGAVTLFGVISVIQLAGVPFLYDRGMTYYSGGVINAADYMIGTVGNVDFAAALLALIIPIITLYVVKAKEKQRFLLLIPAILALFVLLKIWVLLGLVGTFISAFLAFPYALGLKKRGVTVYFILLTVLALTAILVLYAVPFERGLLFELHSILHGEVKETFGTGRFHVWREVLCRIPDNLFFGTGPDTMIFDDAIKPFTRYDEAEGLIVRHIDLAHNEFLNVLYHQGIFAFLSYLAAAAGFLVSYFKNAAKNAAALITGAGVIGYAAALMFGMTMPPIGIFFWVCLGLYEHYTASEPDVISAAKQKKRIRKMRKR